MEGKSVVMSALGIGIGVGVGLGLASAPWAGGASASARAAGVTVERVEQDLRRLLVDGADSKVTFDEFPYYLRSKFPPPSFPSLRTTRAPILPSILLLSAPTKYDTHVSSYRVPFVRRDSAPASSCCVDAFGSVF